MVYTPRMIPHLVLSRKWSTPSHTALAHRLRTPILGLLFRVYRRVMALELREPPIGTPTLRIVAYNVSIEADGPDDGFDFHMRR
jgi:hypothetical protein